MIAAAELAKMKPGALLINVARGPLVVERDLVEAVRSGHLGGAAVDVTEVEPLEASSPLWELPNVIITPHVAGQSRLRIDQMTDFFCENLRRYMAGQPLAQFGRQATWLSGANGDSGRRNVSEIGTLPCIAPVVWTRNSIPAYDSRARGARRSDPTYIGQ